MKIPISMFCGPVLVLLVLDALPAEAVGVAVEPVSAELLVGVAASDVLSLEALPAPASTCPPP